MVRKRVSVLSSQRPRGERSAASLEALVREVGDPGLAQPQRLAVSQLVSGHYQPRQGLGDDNALQELAASIRQLGLIEPLAVRPLSDDRYEILAGHRRWQAAQLAALDEVPVIIHAVDDTTAAAMALVENLQRENLNPMEVATGMRRLLDDFGLKQNDLATLLASSKAEVSKTLALLKLAKPVQTLLREGRLQTGHARVLMALPKTEQLPLAQQAVAQGWSVRELERHRQRQRQSPPPPPTPSPDIRHLEQRLSAWFAAPVAVKQDTKGGGSLTIRFHDDEECQGILERLGLPPEE